MCFLILVGHKHSPRDVVDSIVDSRIHAKTLQLSVSTWMEMVEK